MLEPPRGFHQPVRLQTSFRAWTSPQPRGNLAAFGAHFRAPFPKEPIMLSPRKRREAMAFRSRAIGRERLQMLRAVLETAAADMGVLRGTKEHEQLALRVLQLAEIIPDKERLIAALGGRTSPHRPSPGIEMAMVGRGHMVH
jgi:hypothetical protein